MSQEMKIATFLFAVALTCSFTKANVLRYNRGVNDLKESYIVHYNSRGQALSVAGFEDFVRVLNEQAASPGHSPSSFIENSPTMMSELTTSTEATTSHQPRPLAMETSTTSAPIISTKSSLESAHVTVGSTESPLKFPREMSGTSPVAEASVSTDKPTLTLALGHDAAATATASFSSDLSNLVTPGENSPSKMTVSSLGFPYVTRSASKVFSLLQPSGLQTILNYASPSVPVQSYVPMGQTSYLQASLQKPFYAHSTDTLNYASYPSQNIGIDTGNTPMIVRRAPALIDIGQGLGQGYGSTPQEVAVNLGGWGGVDYGGQRSLSASRPVLGITKLGYAVPASSTGLSKIGFGLGSW